MSSTGKLVVSFEIDPPPDYYSPEIQVLENKIRTLLDPYTETIGRESELIAHGNTFILTCLFGGENFDDLVQSLIKVSKDAWILIYGGLDGEASVMIEAQDGRVVTRRERVPKDTLIDYSVGGKSGDDPVPPGYEGIPY